MFAFPAVIFGAMYLGPTFAMTQALVKVRMRALASAILLFVLNMIGLGPQFVGILSDTLEPTYGKESLGVALLWVVVIGNGWSAVHYFLAAKTLREDLKAKEAPATV